MVFGDLNRLIRLFLKSKIGVIGIVIILFYFIIAIGAPVVAPNAPINNKIASPLDIPAWATLLPGYHNIPVDRIVAYANGFGSQTDLAPWALSGNYTDRIMQGVRPPGTTNPGSLLVNATMDGFQTGNNQLLPGAVALFTMNDTFQFSGSAPNGFTASTAIEMLSMKNVSEVYVNMLITRVSPNATFPLVTYESGVLLDEATITPQEIGNWTATAIPSNVLPSSGIQVFYGISNPSALIFNESGAYRFTVQIMAAPTGTSPGSISFYVNNAQVHLLGGAYGILGTDNYGNDVWSQLAWGSQVSLEIGILAGVGSVALGALLGIFGGFIGGVGDEVLGRFTDFILVIPFLPLLLVVTNVLVTVASLRVDLFEWIIVLFVVISWPGIAKIIRSQVLSVKERPYVEASRAVGSGTGHILRRHILPNVMGLVYSQVALNVAGFIILDAALDFLAIATHSLNVISWGLMLTYSLPYAIVASTASHVWWWFLPPGISIAALSLAFVLVGFALDSIFNPKLRAR